MNNKPMIISNDDLSEGVYASSGAGGLVVSSDCWDVEVTLSQADAGGYSRFRVHGTHHSTGVEHISTKTVVTIKFSAEVTTAIFEGFNVQVNYDTVIATREQHANAYQSGDDFNSDLSIWSPNYSTIQPLSYGITCTHATNVQGKYD